MNFYRYLIDINDQMVAGVNTKILIAFALLYAEQMFKFLFRTYFFFMIVIYFACHLFWLCLFIETFQWGYIHEHEPNVSMIARVAQMEKKY